MCRGGVTQLKKGMSGKLVQQIGPRDVWNWKIVSNGPFADPFLPDLDRLLLDFRCHIVDQRPVIDDDQGLWPEIIQETGRLSMQQGDVEFRPCVFRVPGNYKFTCRR